MSFFGLITWEQEAPTSIANRTAYKPTTVRILYIYNLKRKMLITLLAISTAYKTTTARILCLPVYNLKKNANYSIGQQWSPPTCYSNTSKVGHPDHMGGQKIVAKLL